jgi:hypothetical protein
MGLTVFTDSLLAIYQRESRVQHSIFNLNTNVAGKRSTVTFLPSSAVFLSVHLSSSAVPMPRRTYTES